jgi:4-aminobutyrate aminotransferase/(S)-3-amino-2-methylpropionate transaminase
MDAPGDSQIGGTYVGNPVSIAAAHAVLDAIEEERLVERANEIGDTIRQRMETWSERFSCIGDIRGLGAMLAVEIVRDRDTREPDADLATSIVEAASARGLLLLKAGLYGNCIRVLTPLVVTDEQLDEALGAWEEAFAEATGSHPHVDSAASTT